MNYYNYMLTVQQEAIKWAIKKDIDIRCQEDTTNDVVLITDMKGQAAFTVPRKYFLINTESPAIKTMTTLIDIFTSAKLGGRHIEITNDVFQANPSTQLRKMHSPEDNVDIWINNKFLGYFKGIKHLRYGYFEHRNSKMICAYLDDTFEVLGVAVPMRPKE